MIALLGGKNERKNWVSCCNNDFCGWLLSSLLKSFSFCLWTDDPKAIIANLTVSILSHQASAFGVASPSSPPVFTSLVGWEEHIPHFPAILWICFSKSFRNCWPVDSCSLPEGLGSDTNWEYLIFPLELKSIDSRLNKSLLYLNQICPPPPCSTVPPTQDRDIKSAWGYV